MNASPLSNSQQRYLRGLGHGLKPVILVGARGMSQAVLAELDGALEHHELIKVKIAAGDRQSRDAVVEEMVRRSRAALVQRIGNVALLYRRCKDKPTLALPA
ncbi:MAG TPA: ribosome assembly RNA-binding protein YhbY [Xanthomonadaceae bacterium]|nr:ribosome assembly RNA-binding protein YhbY [Xanthomonadaceae bacterium]